MDKKRSVLNISVSIGFRIIVLVLALLSRRFLIKYVGNEANGLYSLYTSMIGFLAIADLGIGTAINFSLYKPIVEGEKTKVASLYNLYKKIYLIVGTIIFVVGIALLPALPYLAKDYSSGYNLYLTFFIMLCSVVLGYAFSAKTSLINAHKNDYITTTINGLGLILRYVVGIVILSQTQSFELFLLTMVAATLFEWALTEIVTRRKYGDILSMGAIPLDKETKQEIVKNSKAMFMHKIGDVLVNTADSVIISTFISVSILGFYSNYVVIMTALTSLLALFFLPLTSIIGHMCAKKDLEEEKKYFWFLYLFNFVLGIVFFLGYYAVIDSMVYICFAQAAENPAELILSKDISFVITVNYFIQFIRRAVLLFREASGTFYYDRYKPALEGTINVILSILFSIWIGVVGVIVATIITNLFICHIVEPFVLYKHEFNAKPTKYYLVNYTLIGVFCLSLVALHFCLQTFESVWVTLVVNGFIAVGVALVPIMLLAIVSRTFRTNCVKLFRHFTSFLRRKKVAPKASLSGDHLTNDAAADGESVVQRD